MLRTNRSRSLYSMACVTARDLCTGFKFSFPLNIHQFMKSGFRKACKHSFCCKKEQTFWGLKGFVLEDTPVSRVPEHSADRTVSNLQLPEKPSPSQVQLPAGAVEPLSSQWRCWRNQTWGTRCRSVVHWPVGSLGQALGLSPFCLMAAKYSISWIDHNLVNQSPTIDITIFCSY